MRKDLFDQLVESVRQMKAIEAGRRKPARVVGSEHFLTAERPDVASLRRRFGVSQAKFAMALGISVNTLQNWEQHRRRPEGPAKVLLLIVAAHPETLLSVMKQRRSRRPKRAKAA